MSSEKIQQEQGIKKLENERFPISPESLSFLKEAREEFKELQKEIPELNGMTFLGSRTVGQEYQESDLDCFLFFDGSEGWINTAPKIEYDSKSGEFVPTGNFFRENTRSRQMSGKIRSEFYMKHSEKSHGVAYEIISARDISKDALDQNMADFWNLIDREEKEAKVIKNEGLPLQTVWNVVSLFLLGIGHGLYQARKYILDVLEKREDGEKIWAKIVEYISHVERDGETKKRQALPSFKHYPKTIKEAREFFLTKEY